MAHKQCTVSNNRIHHWCYMSEVSKISDVAKQYSSHQMQMTIHTDMVKEATTATHTLGLN